MSIQCHIPFKCKCYGRCCHLCQICCNDLMLNWCTNVLAPANQCASIGTARNIIYHTHAHSHCVVRELVLFWAIMSWNSLSQQSLNKPIKCHHVRIASHMISNRALNSYLISTKKVNEKMKMKNQQQHSRKNSFSSFLKRFDKFSFQFNSSNCYMRIQNDQKLCSTSMNDPVFFFSIEQLNKCDEKKKHIFKYFDEMYNTA